MIERKEIPARLQDPSITNAARFDSKDSDELRISADQIAALLRVSTRTVRDFRFQRLSPPRGLWGSRHCWYATTEVEEKLLACGVHLDLVPGNGRYLTETEVEQRRMLCSLEVAQMINISPSTLRNWCADGRGPPCFRILPQIVRYERHAVQQWRQNNV